jgi:hypothetical protein
VEGLAYGLCNALANIQGAMNRIFGEHMNKLVGVYLDDILIYSKTEAEHFHKLAIVLDLPRKHGWKNKAKETKCEFFKQGL